MCSLADPVDVRMNWYGDEGEGEDEAPSAVADEPDYLKLSKLERRQRNRGSDKRREGGTEGGRSRYGHTAQSSTVPYRSYEPRCRDLRMDSKVEGLVIVCKAR